MEASQPQSWLRGSVAPFPNDMFVQTHVQDLVPLESQLGIDAPKTVPDALRAPLFGPHDAPQSTYAILDAAKLSLVPDILEASGAQHACLFQGTAANQFGDQAPWLVSLDPEGRLTRALMTKGTGPTALWSQDLAVFVRCAAPFDKVRGHLRRFVRIKQAQDDAWFYFRFWERHVAFGLAAAADPEPQALAQALLAPIDGAPQSWVAIDAKRGHAMSLALRNPVDSDRKGAIELHPASRAALEASTLAAQMRDDIHASLMSVPEKVRVAYGAEPQLGALWTALHDAKFTLRDQRVAALVGYLTLVYQHRAQEAWKILTQAGQGPKIRLWHLERALETAA